MKCSEAISSNLECTYCCFHCTTPCNEKCDNPSPDCEFLISEEETGLDVMKKAVPEILRSITELTLQKKMIEDQEKIMKQKILKAMEDNGIKSFENEDVKFLYVAPTTRTSIDSKKLKELYPEIAEECSKTSEVSSSVRISLKRLS